MELDNQLDEVISRFKTNQPIEVYITGVEPVAYSDLTRKIERKFYDICCQRNELLVHVDCQFLKADQIIENLICKLYETLVSNPFLCNQLPNNFRARYVSLYKSIVDQTGKSIDPNGNALNKLIKDLASFQLNLYSEHFAHWWNETRSQLSFRYNIQSLLKWLQSLLNIILIPLIWIIKITYEVLQVIAWLIPSNTRWLGKKHIRILFTVYFPNNIGQYSNLEEQIGLISTNKNAAFIIFSRESSKASIGDNEIANFQKTINIFIRDLNGGIVNVGNNNKINMTRTDSQGNV